MNETTVNLLKWESALRKFTQIRENELLKVAT